MIAYLNGKYLPAAQATIPVADYGFAMGVSLTERLRTFAGQMKLLQRHLDRLTQGLQQLGLDRLVDRAEIERASQEVVRRNRSQVKRGVELSVSIVVTPGVLPGAVSHGSRDGRPTIVITADELPVWRWQDQYRDGVKMVAVETREIPGQCIPRTLKHRNRLHYYLAEKQAAEKSPGSRALLLDTKGFVAEGTIASIVAIKNEQVLCPRIEQVLPSVTLALSLPIFERLGLTVVHQDLSIADLQAADEVLWLSTSPVVLPVSAMDGASIGAEASRPVFDGLLAGWSEFAGTNIANE